MQSQNVEALSGWIRARIEEGGPITVAEFMGHALYHPQLGYYTTGPNIGPRGDFTTSPEASPAFGRLLARHASDIDGLLGFPPIFDLVEFGPGRGTLAHDLLGALRAVNPDLYERLRYWLVEISPALTEAQRALLLPQHERVVTWERDIENVPGGLAGAVIANEVVDAFPVHVLENRKGDILEQYVGVGADDGFRIVYEPPSHPVLLDFLRKHKIELAPGQKVEVNLATNEWVVQLGRVLNRGVATIIDYGDTAPGRYAEARKEGTLLGYYGGSVTDNILARPGQQDLTALVDFTALQAAATQAGFTLLALTRQANFLLGLGLGSTETIEAAGNDLQRALDYRHGLQTLISMEGLGRFHVLLLGKRVHNSGAQAALSGLQYIDI